MIIDGHKIIDQLQELRYNHSIDINQLEEVLYHLKERYVKLSETDDRRYISVILDNIVDSIKNLEETLHKLHEARKGIEKLIQLYQVYVDIEL